MANNRRQGVLLAFIASIIATKFIEERVRTSRWKKMPFVLGGIMFGLFLVSLIVYLSPKTFAMVPAPGK